MAAEPFDVIVVGSGAAGGTAAHALTGAGARVCLLEAGRSYDPGRETPMFQRTAAAPLRDAGTPDKPFGFYDATVDGGWELPEEPFATAPGTEFRWFRARMLGGRTNHWGRVALRYANHDFKAYSRDGLGADWPFTYDEFAPWYDRAERLVGVFGSNPGLPDQPDSPPGCLQPPPVPRSHELLIMAGGRRLGRPVVPSHTAVITQPIDGRLACFYATPCLRGCSIRANFQSTTVLLPPARATGRLTTLTHAQAYEIEMAPDGRARGVHYLDRLTHRHHFIPGRAVMLGASAMESVRLLLNSRSTQFPDGIGADSGLLGRGVMDSTGSNVWGQFPQMENLPPFNDDGVWLPHVYIPWWAWPEQRAGRLPFTRGYHLELYGGRLEPSADTFDFLDDVSPLTYGRRLKEEAQRYYGSFVRLSQRGEMIAREHNRVQIDPVLRDQWGIPSLRFDVRFSDQELRQTAHAQQSMAEFIEAAGGKLVTPLPRNPAEAILPPGRIIHEVGGARTGVDPARSVTDPFGRVWGVPNLYVIDGAVFPSSAHKNPTLTIVAFASRASEHLRKALRHA
ncbi:MAG: GMC family oxidoreductase [Proteobacteria bacterium]|nr:GMC family oxidoreductase [Pseudomonadota bacterium]